MASALPENSERLLRLSAATFGAAWLAGVVEGMSLTPLQRSRQVEGAPQQALASAGVDGRVDVLLFEERTDMYVPGHMVAVDWELQSVVVALRGSSSLQDALTDLVCDAAPLELGGVAGKAHEGMLKAARKLEEVLRGVVNAGFESLGRRRLRVVGHSLGAGVAALLTALWVDAGQFPGADVQCVAFACPQVLDMQLASAAEHTTSVILDRDLVPRFGRATATDLREVLLCLTDPARFGLSPAYRATALLAPDMQADSDRLAVAHGTLRLATRGEREDRLYPPGRLVHLTGGSAWAIPRESLDELLIADGMAVSHLPNKYLAAIREVASSTRVPEVSQPTNED